MNNLCHKMRKIAHFVKVTLLVWRARFFYVQHIRRIRTKVRRGEKVNVLFLVSELGKWKSQTVYDRMRQGHVYDPRIVVITPRGGRENVSREEHEARAIFDFFEKKGMHPLLAYDFEKHQSVGLRAFAPDIVFYQQPWAMDGVFMPDVVSRDALTCYIPYYVPVLQSEVRLHCKLDFHRLLFLYFTLNTDWNCFYKKMSSRLMYAGSFESAGQPSLDRYETLLRSSSVEETGFIIYAPHYTFTHPQNAVPCHLSTFLQTGGPILEYAKRHREQRWIFRPHPGLRPRLISSGAMTSDEVAAYFAEWESIGRIDETSDYIDLFVRSSAMVTDSGGFLAEYPPTGHPLVRLIPQNCDVIPFGANAELFDSFYKVHNLEEMYETFKLVIEKGSDPKRDIRMDACAKLNLVGRNSALRILEHLNQLLAGEVR